MCLARPFRFSGKCRRNRFRKTRAVDRWPRTALPRAHTAGPHLALGRRGDDERGTSAIPLARRRGVCARVTRVRFQTRPNSAALFIKRCARTMGHAFACFRYCLVASAILLGVSPSAQLSRLFRRGRIPSLFFLLLLVLASTGTSRASREGRRYRRARPANPKRAGLAAAPLVSFVVPSCLLRSRSSQRCYYCGSIARMLPCAGGASFRGSGANPSRNLRDDAGGVFWARWNMTVEINQRELITRGN